MEVEVDVVDVVPGGRTALLDQAPLRRTSGATTATEASQISAPAPWESRYGRMVARESATCRQARR
ncbi:hypothetical protein ACFOW4_29525 [Micromonospora sp. GCM10011542]|uniref:hypothetical protein n=1 Tax=Micromonospora sp. GCM10011542 TaxID=3317337 RepID=UPI00361542D5